MLNSISSPESSPSPRLRLIRDEDSPLYDSDWHVTHVELEPEPKREAFGMIPVSVFERLTGDGFALGVYAILAKHANRDGVCWPSVATICESLGWSKKIVSPAIQRLVESGLITKERRQLNGMDQSNAYRISAYEQVVPIEPAVVPTVPLGGSQGTSGWFPQNHELEPIELDKENVYTAPSQNGAKSKAATKPRETTMPADFDLSSGRMEYALAKGLTRGEAEDLYEEMRGWSLAKGGKYIDWNAAWENWVRRRAKQLAATRPANAGHWVPSHV